MMKLRKFFIFLLLFVAIRYGFDLIVIGGELWKGWIGFEQSGSFQAARMEFLLTLLAVVAVNWIFYQVGDDD